ncbi:MAG: Holliday junction branch migration protein RuvA, partial [Gammaproteobacteria bacterium]
MIGRITGTLAAKHPPQVLVDVHGVGYEIDVPMSTFYNLPGIGEKVSLLTHLAVREDAHLLYGFASEIERVAFRELLKVSGIGAKTALAVLSGLSVNDLSAAIAAQETGRIVKVPGIGKKTAERLLLELKGKPVFAGAIAGVEAAGVSDDVRQALLALGYNERETAEAIRQLPA